MSISTYISHMDGSVRRCGMLVAEEVARASGKTLDFGGWDGNGESREWFRQLRDLVEKKDADANMEEVSEVAPTKTQPAEVLPAATTLGASDNEKRAQPAKQTASVAQSGYDSDDSLTGYISSPSSSRSPSPTPSELAEIEKDPTLNVGQPKIVRPVYLAQLGEMIRPTTGVRSDVEQGEVERQEMALNVGEELIRRKRAYGTELGRLSSPSFHGRRDG